MERASYPEFPGGTRDLNYPEFSPRQRGREGTGQGSDVLLGCLRGLGHYQDFSMADILERVELKGVGGEPAPSAPREIPISPILPRASGSTEPTTGRRRVPQSQRPITKGLEPTLANPKEPGPAGSASGRVTQIGAKTRRRHAGGDKCRQDPALFGVVKK